MGKRKRFIFKTELFLNSFSSPAAVTQWLNTRLIIPRSRVWIQPASTACIGREKMSLKKLQTTRSRSHKNCFVINLLTLFCKLDHFIIIHNIYDIAMKRYSLYNRVRKFTPKRFYVISVKKFQFDPQIRILIIATT